MSEGLDPIPTAEAPRAEAGQSSVPTNRYAVFVGLAIAVLAADLATKAWVFSWPGKLSGKVYWVWEGYAGFQTSLNEGALFGMGQGGVFWFAAISVVAACVIPLWLFVGRAANDWWMTVALGGVMGGVLGNLYDRLGLHDETWPVGFPQAGERVYAVRDWVLWQAGDAWRWPNFNLADAVLVVGAAVLFFRALYDSTPQTTDK